MRRLATLLGLLGWAALTGCSRAEAGSFYEDGGSGGGGGGGGSVTQAAYASCGSGSAAGDVCVTTDSPYTRVWDGSAWDDYLQGWGPVVVPPSSGWSWDNQDSAAEDLAGPARWIGGEGSNLSIRYRSAPSTPYTLDVVLAKGASSGGSFQCYIALRASSDGNVLAWGDVVGQFRMHRWTDSTTFSSGSTNQGSTSGPFRVGFRIENDGTNITVYDLVGPGVVGRQIYTETLASFIGTADQIGYGTRDRTTCGILHWDAQ